jgi:acyl-CoA thioester hydrolase
MRAMNPPNRPSEAAADFAWPVRVYYEDTDAGGIVFYANYLKFFERARTEWLRACGVDQTRLSDEAGVIFIVRGATLDYHAPARLDDLLAITCKVERLGRASVDFEQQAWLGDALLATARVRIGSVARAPLRPAAVPPPVLDALRTGPAPDARRAVSTA